MPCVFFADELPAGEGYEIRVSVLRSRNEKDGNS